MTPECSRSRYSPTSLLSPMAITVTPGSQTSARLWISKTGIATPLISTIKVSGERCAARTSMALAMPPRAIGVSENPRSSRHSRKLRSVSPSATKASTRARPAAAWAAGRSIGFGTSRMLLTRSLLPPSRRSVFACRSPQLPKRNHDWSPRPRRLPLWSLRAPHRLAADPPWMKLSRRPRHRTPIRRAAPLTLPSPPLGGEGRVRGDLARNPPVIA